MRPAGVEHDTIGGFFQIVGLSCGKMLFINIVVNGFSEVIDIIFGVFGHTGSQLESGKLAGLGITHRRTEIPHGSAANHFVQLLDTDVRH